MRNMKEYSLKFKFNPGSGLQTYTCWRSKHPTRGLAVIACVAGLTLTQQENIIDIEVWEHSEND